MFCWITDYPMYEYDEKEKKIDFSHNPFSMPQIEMKDFEKTDPLNILAYQYDLVCNGYEKFHLVQFEIIFQITFLKFFQRLVIQKKWLNKNFSGMIKALIIWSASSWRYGSWYRQNCYAFSKSKKYKRSNFVSS